MSERVLNFSEFFTKYSKEGQDDKASLDNLTGAAANFEEGFDKDTYDQAQLGPKKPVASSTEMTPPQPGEQGTPTFTDETEEDMIAPEEEEIPAEAEEDETVTPEESEENDETPEPETGANPKEKIEESLVMGFTSFINEKLKDWEENDPFEEDELEDKEWKDKWDEDDDDDDWKDEDDDDWEKDEREYRRSRDYHEDGYEYCDACGEPIYRGREGASCGCNM